MKKLFTLFFLFGLLTLAQTTHSVTLTWNDNLNPAGTTYTVYRVAGLCSGTPTFAKIATAVAVKTYQDSSVTPGNYCYTVTATYGGGESPQPAPVGSTVLPFAPTGLSVTVAQLQITVPETALALE